MRRTVLFLLAAIALPIRAAETPESTIHAFYAAYAAGDVAGAAGLWDAEAAPGFIRKTTRHFRARCVTHQEISIDAPVVDADKATIDAEAFVIVSSGSRVWTETRFTTFHLVNRDGWRIARWTDREAMLADRIGDAKSSAERKALLDAAGRLRTPRLVWELCRKALVLVNRNEIAVATELVDAAREIASDTADEAAASVVLGLEASVLLREPAYERALERAREAIALAERSENPDAIGRALLRYGAAHHSAFAFVSHQEYDRIMSLGDSIDDAAILANAASFLGFRGVGGANPPVVLRYAQVALHYAEISGQNAALFNANFALGEAYSDLGYAALARRHYVRALEVAERAGYGTSAAFALLRIADIAVRRNPDEAMRAIERGLSLAIDEVKSGLLLLRVFHGKGRDDAANERDLDDAWKAVARDPYRIAVLIARSEIRSRQGHAQEALEIAYEAMRLADSTDLFRYPAIVHTQRLLRRMKRYDEARKLAAEASCLVAGATAKAGFDELTWAKAYSDHSAFENELLELAVDRKDVAEALRLANETRARALRVFVERSVELPSRSMSDEEDARARTLEAELAELNRKAVAANVTKAQRPELQQQIERVRLDLDELRARSIAARESRLPTPSAIPDPLTLAPSHTVVQFVGSHDSVIILGFGPGKGAARRVIATKTTISADEVRERIGTLLELLERRDLRYARAARELFDVLLGPVQSLIHRDAMLCIIPDGDLWRVPFHALRTPEGKYLAEVTPVFYAPAMSLAKASAPRRRSGAPSLVAFANPEIHARSVSQYRSAFSAGQVGSLPEAEDEVREVARLYGGNSRVYIGERATEENLKREAWRADIIHIATHGAVDPASPLASAMLLAPGTRTEDGVLEAREILELDLEADLAVLSACNTGGGETRPGEGIIGLSWAFLASGCPTAVASNWNATSNVTSSLMIEFHRQLRAGHSAAVALQTAQKKVRSDERYRHPYYWAPFVVIGAQ